jgi:hypothetical protein
MEPRGGAQPERTGIEGAAAVFSAAAVVNVALSVTLLHTGWLGEIGAHRFLFLGLELAAIGLTTSALALAIGPHRGAGARPAWLAGAGALLLVGFTVAFLLPRIFGAGIR